jgi:hypothetical protein
MAKITTFATLATTCLPLGMEECARLALPNVMLLRTNANKVQLRYMRSLTKIHPAYLLCFLLMRLCMPKEL